MNKTLIDVFDELFENDKRLLSNQNQDLQAKTKTLKHNQYFRAKKNTPKQNQHLQTNAKERPTSPNNTKAHLHRPGGC